MVACRGSAGCVPTPRAELASFFRAVSGGKATRAHARRLSWAAAVAAGTASQLSSDQHGRAAALVRGRPAWSPCNQPEVAEHRGDPPSAHCRGRHGLLGRTGTGSRPAGGAEDPAATALPALTADANDRPRSEPPASDLSAGPQGRDAAASVLRGGRSEPQPARGQPARRRRPGRQGPGAAPCDVDCETHDGGGTLGHPGAPCAATAGWPPAGGPRLLDGWQVAAARRP